MAIRIVIVSVLIAAVHCGLPTSAVAQFSNVDLFSIADSLLPGAELDEDGAADGWPTTSEQAFLDACQESMLVQSFPLLRTLIDLVSELLDLLNQWEGLLDGGPLGIPAIDDSTGDFTTDILDSQTLNDQLDSLGQTGDLVTGAADTTPGGWGQGPVPSVP